MDRIPLINPKLVKVSSTIERAPAPILRAEVVSSTQVKESAENPPASQTKEQAERGRLNPKMFNAFLDGSKPSIESVAIANTANLSAPSNGLIFPSGGIDDIPTLMRPISEGGILENKGMIDVVSCLTPDGKQIPYDIRKGVWVVFEADTKYLKNCFEEYKVVTDPSGKYMSLYKRWHLIGLELAISIASIGNPAAILPKSGILKVFLLMGFAIS